MIHLVGRINFGRKFTNRTNDRVRIMKWVEAENLEWILFFILFTKRLRNAKCHSVQVYHWPRTSNVLYVCRKPLMGFRIHFDHQQITSMRCLNRNIIRFRLCFVRNSSQKQTSKKRIPIFGSCDICSESFFCWWDNEFTIFSNSSFHFFGFLFSELICQWTTINHYLSEFYFLNVLNLCPNDRILPIATKISNHCGHAQCACNHHLKSCFRQQNPKYHILLIYCYLICSHYALSIQLRWFPFLLHLYASVSSVFRLCFHFLWSNFFEIWNIS